MVDIFIGNDKSPKQRRVETSIKRLGRVFESVHPNLKVFVNRRKGTISHQWVDIAKIEAPRRNEDVQLLFQDAKMSEFGFEKEKVREKFANFVSRHAGDDMWCS
eukprot:8613962-Karenia_brevis.AAC.1